MSQSKLRANKRCNEKLSREHGPPQTTWLVSQRRIVDVIELTHEFLTIQILFYCSRHGIYSIKWQRSPLNVMLCLLVCHSLSISYWSIHADRLSDDWTLSNSTSGTSAWQPLYLCVSWVIPLGIFLSLSFTCIHRKMTASDQYQFPSKDAPSPPFGLQGPHQ